MTSRGDARRTLPSVSRLLGDPGVLALSSYPRSVVVQAVRDAIEDVRSGRVPIPGNWADDIRHRIEVHTRATLAPVLNATGVVLHTNLGRAPLSRAAIDAITSVAQGYSALELDLTSGSRGRRADHCRRLLAEVAAAEDALVVNNAAGALVLALNAAAEGREVLLSRGELVEIGGSFRIPDILAKSGARLVEVGTTNRTHLDDYRAALTDRTGAILTVHRSNFELRGYVASPEPTALADLAAESGVPYIYDIGSGLCADLSPWGLTGEPRVSEAVAAGADLVIFSGDKLLGGPQAGCMVGRRDRIAATRQNPLARALRADKLTLAGLAATLAAYRDPVGAVRDLPVLAMLTATPETLAVRAQALADALPSAARATTAPGNSAAGGGAFPEASLPSTLVVLDPPGLDAGAVAERLRQGRPPVLARIAEGKVVLDPRTLLGEDLPRVAEAVGRAVSP